MKLIPIFLAMVVTLPLSACKPAEAPTGTASSPTGDAPKKEGTAPPEANLVKAGTGVPECDQYLEKIYACVSDKMPEAQRNIMKQSIEQSKAGWTAAADKSALATQCKTAMEQAKAAYSALGCTF